MLVFVVTSRMAAADNGGEPSLPAGPFRWQECAGELARNAGRSPLEIEKLLTALMTGSISTSPDFMTLVVAVIAAESNLVSSAKSTTSSATGLMQVTEVGAREAEKQCPFLIREYRNRRSLTDPTTNVAYGSCLLRHYLNQVNGNTFLALVLYNGGYRQLTRLATNATLVTETREYVLRVHHYLRRCQ
jgi:hypothetical protein